MGSTLEPMTLMYHCRSSGGDDVDLFAAEDLA